MAETGADRVEQACKDDWNANKDNCSGFVKAVAADLGIQLSGQANDIVDQIDKAPWLPLQNGVEAKQKADAGYFVLGGLKDDPNGHVVVVVAGPLDYRGKYPTAYWGRLHSIGKQRTTLNYAWDQDDRDKISYAYTSLP